MIYKNTRFFYKSNNEEDQDISTYLHSSSMSGNRIFYTFVKITRLLIV
jgi:hypothetical protein